MGTVCENIATNAYPSIEDPDATRVSFYEACPWPEDQLFRTKYQKILQQTGNSQYFQSKTLQRHRVNDEYYLGDWDLAGYQKGQGILYRPGELLYWGNFDSVPHGMGTLEDLKNELTYEGEFNHGRIEGNGKLTKHNHLYSYEGSINCNSQPTTGILTVNSSDPSQAYRVYLDNYPQNHAKIEFHDGRKYEGEISLNTFLPDGQGTSTYPNGSAYQGNWRNGEFEGFGKFTWSNGSEYSGGYVNGKKHGHGRFVYPSKKVYEGNWVDGRQQGQGSMISRAGHLLQKGNWRAGSWVSDN